jgi:hypothetical protein
MRCREIPAAVVTRAALFLFVGGGNAQKSATARAKNLDKNAPKKGKGKACGRAGEDTE